MWFASWTQSGRSAELRARTRSGLCAYSIGRGCGRHFDDPHRLAEHSIWSRDGVWFFGADRSGQLGAVSLRAGRGGHPHQWPDLDGAACISKGTAYSADLSRIRLHQVQDRKGLLGRRTRSLDRGAQTAARPGDTNRCEWRIFPV